jgi:hypothetical protein
VPTRRLISLTRTKSRPIDAEPIKEDKNNENSIHCFAGILSLTQTSLSFADNANGKNLYLQRCSMCHGMVLKATGLLANKSNPPTPDLTTSAFKKRLDDYSGVIVSSIILRPNGDLIPRTLRENGVKLSPHSWSIKDLRDLTQYLGGVISQNR